MRVGGGIAEHLSHAFDEFGTRGVLEPLGLVVHVVPRKTQPGDEVTLDDSMPTNQLERDRSSRLGESRAAISLGLHETEAPEPLQHSAHARGGNSEPLGYGVGAGRCVGALQFIDGLR